MLIAHCLHVHWFNHLFFLVFFCSFLTIFGDLDWLLLKFVFCDELLSFGKLLFLDVLDFKLMFFLLLFNFFAPICICIHDMVVLNLRAHVSSCQDSSFLSLDFTDFWFNSVILNFYLNEMLIQMFFFFNLLC